MTIIFLIVCVTLLPFSIYSVQAAGQGTPDHRHRAGGAAGLPDSDHDRRPALGHRHRRHGPHDPGQRDRHVGPRGRSGRRRRRAAARQDRHDHAGQSPGRRVHSRAGRANRRARRRGPARVAGRRNARRPQHRRAGQGEVRPARPQRPRAARDVHSVLGADAHQRRRPRRPHRSARARRDAIEAFVREQGGDVSAGAAAQRSRTSPSAAARRWSSRKAPQRSA